MYIGLRANHYYKDQAWYLPLHDISPQTFDGVLGVSREFMALYEEIVAAVDTVDGVCQIINDVEQYLNDRFMS